MKNNILFLAFAISASTLYGANPNIAEAARIKLAAQLTEDGSSEDKGIRVTRVTREGVSFFVSKPKDHIDNIFRPGTNVPGYLLMTNGDGVIFNPKNGKFYSVSSPNGAHKDTPFAAAFFMQQCGMRTVQFDSTGAAFWAMHEEEETASIVTKILSE